MDQVLELVVSWIVMNGLTYLILVLDERWMTEDQLERAWSPVSRDAAIIGFGPIALLLHFPRTRGHFKSLRGVFLGIPLGCVMGIVAVLIVMLGLELLGLVLEQLGLPMND